MKSDEMHIIRQELGRFDYRFGIGPAQWPHFDLLWIHEGAVRVCIGKDKRMLELRAPSGVLIFPETPFYGSATGDFAKASICHFDTGRGVAVEADRGYCLPDPQDTLHVQNLIRLSLAYARRSTEMDVRRRLLGSILDCFGDHVQPGDNHDRLEQAWSYAQKRLPKIRGLADVAAATGLSESTFRTLHRNKRGASAGKHLQDLRLSEAERLLATTGDTVAQVSLAVGYAHAESFSAAFNKSRGHTPAAYRRWCKRFA